MDLNALLDDAAVTTKPEPPSQPIATTSRTSSRSSVAAGGERRRGGGGQCDENVPAATEVDVSKPTDECANCHARPGDSAMLGKSLRRCACRLKSFCSRECQRQLWRRHKEECTSARAALAAGAVKSGAPEISPPRSDGAEKSKKTSGVSQETSYPRAQETVAVGAHQTFGADDDCSICLFPLVDRQRLRCGHMFCRQCLEHLRQHAQASKSCPNCRQYLDSASELADSAMRKVIGLVRKMKDRGLTYINNELVFVDEAPSDLRGDEEAIFALLDQAVTQGTPGGGLSDDVTGTEFGPTTGQIDSQSEWGVFYWLSCYRDGRGVPMDMENATLYLTKLATKGSVRAQLELSRVLDSTDIVRSVEWLQAACDQDSPEALCNMSVYYGEGKRDGNGQQVVPMDTAKAKEYKTRAAELGSKNAQESLGWVEGQPPTGVAKLKYDAEVMSHAVHASMRLRGLNYSSGDSVPSDLQPEMARLVAVWRELATVHESSEAQHELGNCFMMGQGVAKDEFEAVRWFRKSAEQGNIDGQYNLGVNLSAGVGVPTRDIAEAIKWYQLAGSQGLVRAQFNCGLLLMKGDHSDFLTGDGFGGIPPDLAEAARWFRRAADAEHSGGHGTSADAMFMLGVMYERGDMDGEEGRQDFSEAARWFRMGAKFNDPDSIGRLADCYLKGLGVAKDHRKAQQIMRVGAELGDANCQFNVAVLLQPSSEEAHWDHKEMFKWASLAAQQGHGMAQEMFSTLASLSRRTGLAVPPPPTPIAPPMNPKPRTTHQDMEMLIDRVEICGTSRADLNGTLGTAERFDSVACRYFVKLDLDEKVMKIKPGNLRDAAGMYPAHIERKQLAHLSFRPLF